MTGAAAPPTARAVDPRTPCLIGAAQRTWHLDGDEQAPEPLAMWAETARAAAADVGATTGDAAVLAALGSVAVVNCMSWPYDDPVGRLADELGIAPAARTYSTMSGTMPLALVAEAAEAMASGRLDAALVVGGEALDTKRRLKKAGERPAWSHRAATPPPMDPSIVFLPTEIPHEVFQAWLTFAVRDVARRAALGRSPGEDRRLIGELLAPMTDVAAANPHAWFARRRTADELVTPSAENRLVGYPYTKSTVAIMDVDMAAGVILATHETAERLGVPAERRVYLRSIAAASDAVHLAQHPDLARSPGMARVFGRVVGAAGVGAVEVAHRDLYSCFASSIRFALDALGEEEDALVAPVTVTGGLPFCGGPASNYVSHALASMVDVLRADPGSAGLVSGVGMHMTRHAAALWSTDPGGVPRLADPGPAAEALEVRDAHTGPATVAAYSVVHGRDGAPAWGLVVADLADGARCYGRVVDADLLGALEVEEWVGRTVRVTAQDDGVNRVDA